MGNVISWKCDSNKSINVISMETKDDRDHIGIVIQYALEQNGGVFSRSLQVVEIDP